MMRFLILAALVAGYRGDDKIGKLKAPEILKKTTTLFLKMKGCSVKEEMKSPILSKDGKSEGTASLEGKIIKDFAALKGTCEAYCKGTSTLVKNTKGEFQDPVKFQDEESRTAAMIRNPQVLLTELLGFWATANFTTDEKVGDLDCKVAETLADEKTMMNQIKEITSHMNAPWKQWVKDISAFCDKKKSTSTYKAWINKDDFQVAKLEWELFIFFDKKSIPFGADQIPDSITSTYKVTYTKYDTELDVDIPAAVKKAFKIQ